MKRYSGCGERYSKSHLQLGDAGKTLKMVSEPQFLCVREEDSKFPKWTVMFWFKLLMQGLFQFHNIGKVNNVADCGKDICLEKSRRLRRFVSHHAVF